MSRYCDSNTIYKDMMYKKVAGVCAGVARHYNKERWVVRAVTLVALILFPKVTVVAYVVAALLMRSR